MSGRLDGKVAVVTGGARGIGAAIAHGMTAAGAIVVVGDLSAPRTGDSTTSYLDVTSEKSVVAFLDAVVDEHGGLDILVNNAGIMFEQGLEGHPLDRWNDAISVNLTGPFLMAKHAVTHFRARGGGNIVNIGSIEGFSRNPDHAAYSASKAGLHGLTGALAVDLGPMGVRCNAIAPGWIDTELNAAYVNAHPVHDEVIAQLAELHPVGRIGDPGDVADVAVWLAGDESRFVTGQVITVDGSRSATSAPRRNAGRAAS